MERWLELYAESVFRRYPDVHHDLKTPLNIAVLNLELLRMRVRRLVQSDEDDPKLMEYLRSVDNELRRMAQIFDALFHETAPPREGAPPERVDLAASLGEAFGAVDAPCPVLIHPGRGKTLILLLKEGCGKIFRTPPSVVIEIGEQTIVRFEGSPADAGADVGRLFKLYYSDSAGNPDITLATARLIAESYGGGLDAVSDGEKMKVELRLPSGDS